MQVNKGVNEIETAQAKCSETPNAKSCSGQPVYEIVVKTRSRLRNSQPNIEDSYGEAPPPPLPP